MNINSNSNHTDTIPQNVNERNKEGVVPEKILYTVKEVSTIMHTNTGYVYQLISSGLLPALKLGSYKIRHISLMRFLEDYDGYDLTDPRDVEKISVSA
ncbi:helix-turn-helix domain-containing protein [uncultured Ruminococcus sp.]|uniref:helix-turn-helix domain-containing protein n=1 Tax=uncultured Ruminococcus sp. TaxID=165186 RepID=UPI0025CCD6C9|nr:helix-turn-helix domain-containing protein [uncultured Ruminococcus sp.]